MCLSTPPAKCHSCADRDAPKWQCYRAAYNEKRAFAAYRLLDEYAVLPANSFPAGHQSAPATQTHPAAVLDCQHLWYQRGALASPQVPVSTGQAFFAYGYPEAFSSNTGYEAANSMVTFMVQDGCCTTYLLVLIDKPDGTGGFVNIDLMTTGLAADPIDFLNDPQGVVNGNTEALDSYTYSSNHENGTVSLTWSTGNDGFVVGPLPYNRTWSVNMKVASAHRLTRGLETFKIGSYDSYRNDVGFVEASIQKATHGWGGLQYDAMECTDWCQRYTDCSACVKDEQCQFSSAHGGCVAADAYIYNFGCPRPMYAPPTHIMHREGEAYSRESVADNFDAALVMRYGYDARLDMTCPCNTRYHYFATVYDVADGMRPVYTIKQQMRTTYQHTFVDLPASTTAGREYKIYSYLCVAQGTLDRDDCSPVTVDTWISQHNPPPPSPPPPFSPP
jgi:hypothetical protein